MGLTAAQRQRLAGEGLVTVHDFEDFNEKQLDLAMKNLRTSIPAVPPTHDANGNVIAPGVPGINPCLIPARQIMRLKVASVAFAYYTEIGRIATPVNMNYTNVLKAFFTEWEALKKLAEEDAPEVPTLSSKNMPIKWIESFKDAMSRTFGVRNAPLTYVLRESDQVPAEADDPLAPGCAYGTSGSVTDELISRLSHVHPLFKTDNASAYSKLEQSTRGTIYAATIKPYANAKNGRAAWYALINSHAGDDKYEKMHKEKLAFLMNQIWNGKQYSLEKFCGLHSSNFIALQDAANHVTFQLPTKHSRVGYLLDNIKSDDNDLKAALSSVRANTNNMRDNFEETVKFILPMCPYSKKRSVGTGNKKVTIADVMLQGRSDTTGVEFRWHTDDEYYGLNQAQKDELYKWQHKTPEGRKCFKAGLAQKKAAGGSNGGGQGSGKGHRRRQTQKKWQAKVASLEKQLNEKKVAENEEKQDKAEVAAIMDVLATIGSSKAASKRKDPEPTSAPMEVAAIKLQQILKRNKSEKSE